MVVGKLRAWESDLPSASLSFTLYVTWDSSFDVPGLAGSPAQWGFCVYVNVCVVTCIVPHIV